MNGSTSPMRSWNEHVRAAAVREAVAPAAANDTAARAITASAAIWIGLMRFFMQSSLGSGSPATTGPASHHPQSSNLFQSD